MTVTEARVRTLPAVDEGMEKNLDHELLFFCLMAALEELSDALHFHNCGHTEHGARPLGILLKEPHGDLLDLCLFAESFVPKLQRINRLLTLLFDGLHQIHE